MLIKVEYVAQIKRAAGTAREEVKLPDGTCLSAAIEHLAKQHGDPLASMLVNADGAPISTLLLFLGAEQVRLEENPELTAGAELTISTPISGG